jgi:hypothetical protein
MAEIEVDVNLDSLAWSLARRVTEARLMEFILEVDELRCDLSFTKRLHATLGKAIEEEEKER